MIIGAYSNRLRKTSMSSHRQHKGVSVSEAIEDTVSFSMIRKVLAAVGAVQSIPSDV